MLCGRGEGQPAAEGDAAGRRQVLADGDVRENELDFAAGGQRNARTRRTEFAAGGRQVLTAGADRKNRGRLLGGPGG